MLTERSERGFRVFLVNASHSKHLPGQKSNVKECQRLMKLHTCGLLNDSFQLSEDIRVLSAYCRYRDEHFRATSAAIQGMQKVLAEMNVPIAIVISDISAAIPGPWNQISGIA